MRIHETIEKILDLSKADDCIVIGARGSGANVRWANNTTTTNGAEEDAHLTIISVKDRRVGVISRNHFPDDSLEDLVRESEAACDGKPEAEDFMPLLEPDDEPVEWDAPAEATDVGVFASTAPQLAELFARADMEGLKTFGYAEHGVSTYWVGTSTGLRRRDSRAEGKIEFTAKTRDLARSSWTGRVTHDFRDVDVHEMYARLVERIDWSKNQLSLDPGPYEVLLEPSAVSDMALYAFLMGTARDADEGQTVYSKPGGGNRIGEKLYGDGITLYSDPREPGFEVLPFHLAIGSGSYQSTFDNGLMCGRTEWVKEGVLNRLITPRYWAEKSGGTPTPFIPNLIFAGDNGASLDDMIDRTERALLVTCLWYIRIVDPRTLLLTGLTRDGVFLVEGGEVKGAVNNFRYNMSPITMFANTVEVGKPEAAFPREFGDSGFAVTKMPPLRVRDWNMSSVSEAT